jgi:hypothetical protein
VTVTAKVCCYDDLHLSRRSRKPQILGLIGLKNVMSEHLPIRQGNTMAATVFSPEDPLLQAYRYSGIELKIVPLE